MTYAVYLDIVHPECLQNLISSSRLHRYLTTNSHTITTTPTTADVILISTCGFCTQTQDLSFTRYTHHHTHKKPTTRIIIYGCLVHINPDLFTGSDALLIGLHDNETLDQFFSATTKYQDITPYCADELKTTLTDEKRYRLWRTGPFLLTNLLSIFSRRVAERRDDIQTAIARRQRDFIEISQGCQGDCNYCVIKKARGTLHSRPIPDILADINNITNPAHTLFLVGDDCGCYGRDRETTFLKLLEEIRHQHPHLPIDINYLNPQWLIASPDEYLQAFSTMDIKSVIIPLQSGSQRVIHTMNRSYDVAKTLTTLRKISQASPQTILYGHFIVGFPGETFMDSLRSLLAARYFDYPTVFIYSDTKGAASIDFPHKIPEFTKHLRWLFFMITINATIALRTLQKKEERERRAE